MYTLLLLFYNLIIFSFLVALASFVACKKDKLTEPSSNERSVLEEVCNTSDKIVERIKTVDKETLDVTCTKSEVSQYIYAQIFIIIY